MPKLIGPNQPTKSRVQLEYTLVSKSVQRRHASHYVQEGIGRIFAHPQLPQDGKIILPDTVKEPTVVGTFHFWLVQVFQAVADGVRFGEMFMDEQFAPVAGIFSHVPGTEGHFRLDLGMNASNQVGIIDEFEITEPVFAIEELKQQCLEEFMRVFCYMEVLAVRLKVKIAMKTLKAMHFRRVDKTGFVVLDNHPPMAGEMGCAAIVPIENFFGYD